MPDTEALILPPVKHRGFHAGKYQGGFTLLPSETRLIRFGCPANAHLTIQGTVTSHIAGSDRGGVTVFNPYCVYGLTGGSGINELTQKREDFGDGVSSTGDIYDAETIYIAIYNPTERDAWVCVDFTFSLAYAAE